MKDTTMIQSCKVLLCIIKECQTGKKYTGYDNMALIRKNGCQNGKICSKNKWQYVGKTGGQSDFVILCLSLFKKEKNNDTKS